MIEFLQQAQKDPSILTSEPYSSADGQKLGTKIQHGIAFLKRGGGSVEIEKGPAAPKTFKEVAVSKISPDATAEQVRKAAGKFAAETRKPEGKPTTTKIQAGIIQKWLDDKTLSSKEQKIIDKFSASSRKSPEEVKADTVARIQGKVDSFKSLMDRDPFPAEKRAMIINDPYGILAPEDVEGVVTPTDVLRGAAEATKAKTGEIGMDQDDQLVVESLATFFPADQFKGETKTDSKTGRDYKSNGVEWFRVK